jgi:ankyrin repeat protein
MMRRGGHKHQVLEAEEDSSSSSSSTGEDELRGRQEGKEEEEEKGPVDYRHRVMKGSFLPAIVMLDMKQIGIEDPIDST